MTKRIELCMTLLAALTSLLALPAYAQVTQTEIQKLLAADAGSGDNFGRGIAIDGDTVVIGADWESDSGTIYNGAAYVFPRDGGTWNQQAKLLASDKAGRDQFGYSVALDGDTAVIGAFVQSDSGTRENGAGYVFTRSAGTWTQQAKLLANDKADHDWFGYSVAIDGDTAVISAGHDSDSGTTWNGAAYVFTRNHGSWTQQAKLLASDKASGDDLGGSVAIDGDTFVIGAIFESDSGTYRNGAA